MDALLILGGLLLVAALFSARLGRGPHHVTELRETP